VPRHDDPPSASGAAKNSAPPSGAPQPTRTRTKRADSDSDSNGAPPAKKPRTEPGTEAPSTRGSADGGTPPPPPNPSSDDYAAHVLNVAGRSPLSENQLGSLREGVDHAVRRSQSWLSDQHTADTIRGTVLDALDQSPTFRAAVSYGMHNQQEDLDDITYRNRYVLNMETFDASKPLDMRELTLDELQRTNTANVPIQPANEAGRDEDYALGPSYVSFSAAPNAGSPYMPSWQEGLVHELIHHVTGARDPEGSAEHEHGPTEILARRVADEMHWQIPASTGYGDPARIEHLHEANRAALIDAAGRHADRQHDFFGRLETLSRGEPASQDFRELGNVPSNRTHPEQSGNDYLDFDQIELDPSTFGFFADSSPSGAPTGFQSAAAASGASWSTQGRFFHYGQPVNGNPHARSFGFPDGSRVVVSAHEPMLADSDGMKFGRFMTVAGSAAVGGAAGFLAGGPLGALGGAVAAAIPSATLAHSYDFDRIWQGYTLDYYDHGGQAPFYTQYMYAWDSDATRTGKLSVVNDPKAWPDYANYDPDPNWSWWKWKTGDAPLRA
jgi:hypothetical protein